MTEGLRGTISAWGACLPLTERLPFLPVAKALERAARSAQIGAELFINPKTASVHVSNILRKLGVSGRAQAAAERAGLLDAIREQGTHR